MKTYIIKALVQDQQGNQAAETFKIKSGYFFWAAYDCKDQVKKSGKTFIKVIDYNVEWN